MSLATASTRTLSKSHSASTNTAAVYLGAITLSHEVRRCRCPGMSVTVSLHCSLRACSGVSWPCNIAIAVCRACIATAHCHQFFELNEIPLRCAGCCVCCGTCCLCPALERLVVEAEHRCSLQKHVCRPNIRSRGIRPRTAVRSCPHPTTALPHRRDIPMRYLYCLVRSWLSDGG